MEEVRPKKYVLNVFERSGSKKDVYDLWIFHYPCSLSLKSQKDLLSEGGGMALFLLLKGRKRKMAKRESETNDFYVCSSRKALKKYFLVIIQFSKIKRFEPNINFLFSLSFE